MRDAKEWAELFGMHNRIPSQFIAGEPVRGLRLVLVFGTEPFASIVGLGECGVLG